MPLDVAGKKRVMSFAAILHCLTLNRVANQDLKFNTKLLLYLSAEVKRSAISLAF